MKIYGIGNCDTCRKAKKWLDASGTSYTWTDLREHGVSRSTIRSWIDAVGLEKLVNRRSTSWRGLDEAERKRAMSPESAPELLASHPTLVKRPVVDVDGRIQVGFDDAVKQSL